MVSPQFDQRRFQVFVSSTFRDLEPERQKVLQAILEMRAFPSGMELFPSADDEQWEFIKREIESSDYYVVIVGGKYGSLASTGQSFTEMEYDYAVACGKPVMGFLFHDLGELKGSLLETDDGRRNKLDIFRAKVTKGRLIKHYRNPDELKALVIQALASSFQMRPGEGWIRAANARRVEDLEKITLLQEQIIRLEAENTTLKTLDAAQSRKPYLVGEASGFESIGKRGETYVDQAFVSRYRELKFTLELCNHRGPTTNLSEIVLNGSNLSPIVRFARCTVPVWPQLAPPVEFPCGIKKSIDVFSEAAVSVSPAAGLLEIDLASLVVNVIDAFGDSHPISIRDGSTLEL